MTLHDALVLVMQGKAPHLKQYAMDICALRGEIPWEENPASAVLNVGYVARWHTVVAELLLLQAMVQEPSP